MNHKSKLADLEPGTPFERWDGIFIRAGNPTGYNTGLIKCLLIKPTSLYTNIGYIYEIKGITMVTKLEVDFFNEAGDYVYRTWKYD